MGVDFYHCTVCDESRYEEYVGWCQGCSNGLCTACLVNKENDSPYAYQHGLIFDSEEPELMKEYEALGYALYKEDGESYYDDGDVIDDSGIADKFCPYCTGKKIDEGSVLLYLLDKYDLKIEEVWEEMNKK